jgi:flavin-dependent dehydrogenase
MSGKAVVIGASIAGLAAARVLSDRYGSVVVLERDELPNTSASRHGVPQGPHAHILTTAGLHEFERLLPGFRADLIAVGGTAIDICSELYMSRYNRAWPPVPSEVEFVSVSRPTLELVLRKRVAELPPVAIREGVTVTALTGTPDAVTGVLLASGEQIAAELVVDCTGRAGRSDRWLADLGSSVPEQVDIKMGLGYATRLFQRGSDDLPGWKGILAMSDPPRESMMGMALPIEDDRWLVGLVGWHGRASAEMVRDYYRAAAAVVATPWQLAVDGDFAYPETTGPRPRGVGFRNGFATRLMLASQVVPDLKPTFFGVLQLVVPPDRLMRPRVVMQALLHGRRPARTDRRYR